MSNILPEKILKSLNFERFKSCVRVDNKHCLEYIRRQSVADKKVILTAHLPYECARVWSCAREEALANQIPCSYINIFNAFLYEITGFKVKKDAQRLEQRLRKVASETKAKFIGKNGKAYRTLCQKEVKVALQMEELETLSEVDSKLSEQKSVNDQLQKEKYTLQERYDSLVKDMGEAQEAERIVKEKVGAEIQDLKEQNLNLQDYIQGLGQDLDFRNKGYKNLSDIGERQRRRKMNDLKTNVEKALWFAKTFGLELQSANFKDELRANHTLSYCEKVQKSYKDLAEEDQQNVKNVLFILDKFCIGGEAYHELSMIDGNDELPKSYLIKQCKDELNKLCHITRTPGSAQGAQLDFLTELESVVQKQVCL